MMGRLFVAFADFRALLRCFTQKTLMPGLAVVLLAAALSVAVIQPVRAAEKAMLLLNWYPYSEHAPFFLGKERGYFAAEGIDLEIQEGRGSVSTIQAVAGGTADFGYADIPTMIKAATKGAPVISTGVLLQKSPMAVISLAEYNIRKPQDLKGKTVAVTPGDAPSQVWPLFLKKVGLTESEMSIVGGDAQTKINAVVNGRANAMLGYLMDQNMKIEEASKKPTVVMPFSDYGLNLISSGLLISKDTATKRAALVRGFMKAAIRSVQETEKDPEAAIDAMLRAYPKAGPRGSLVAGLKLTIPLYYTDETKGQPPFRVSDANFAASVNMMVEYQGIEKEAAADPKRFYSLDFLPK
jgi:NitT/TauT family transport system substrate-binding protein